MMKWEKVLEYQDDVVEIATKLGLRMDPSLIEDAIQYTFMILHTKVNLDNVNQSEREYVRGAIWNNVQRFYRDERRHNHASLENIVESGGQIDQENNLRWPSKDHNYSGTYKEDE